MPSFPAKPIVALSYLDPSARLCRRFSIARSSFSMVGNHMARSGVDSGEGVRNAGDASRYAINKRTLTINNPDLVACHSGYMAPSSSPKLVVCYAFNATIRQERHRAHTSIRYPTWTYVAHVVSLGVMSFHPFHINDAVRSQTPILDCGLVSREFVERLV